MALHDTAIVGYAETKIVEKSDRDVWELGAEILDILLDKTGQVKAFIVGVGGVLGLGAREVAIDMTQFHEMPAANGGPEQLKLGMTKDQLAQADEFKPLPNPPTTTGAAPSGSRPAGSPPAAPPR